MEFVGLYKFIKKPTVAVHYKGDTLKRLLEQRWTGHLATVTVVLKSFDDIFSLFRAFGTDLQIEAAGLIRAVSEPSFEFIGRFVQKILQLLDAPNKMLQSEQMDLLSGMRLVKSASECVAQLRSESEFNNIDSDSVKRQKGRKRGTGRLTKVSKDMSLKRLLASSRVILTRVTLNCGDYSTAPWTRWGKK